VERVLSVGNVWRFLGITSVANPGSTFAQELVGVSYSAVCKEISTQEVEL
jgi:hypothetical protein